ncbi:MAG TPA: DmsC/YnfH family molybdoenzyme membrane anchor subunit, partial [Acidobacteriaceae bacterium]|nr:DmsC/YnfH family molybdoenzyme membrane anchor subunit [Acidobacteriaceae bacterium]
MELPLLTRVQEGNDVFHLTTATPFASGDSAETLQTLSCGVGTQNALPRLPGPGEQYRFHFDMTKCIGCKCCVVACNEQNGNPAEILWRRVGEIEGGVYPSTHRHYLSIGCNHCLEPTCLSGCPVEAYTKDGLTGIVRHSADACIGCQYCTWNCSYGVPQYNPERGVVGKCDMCYGRLTRGQEPACASACPEGAIRIEVVNIAAWRADYEAANSPGMPSADDSISTTRITLPQTMPADVRKVDLTYLRQEHAHWPLIVMTVLTQLSVGAFTSIWYLQTFASQSHRAASLVALFVAMLALAASTLHLGRPVHAIRALKMWRRSWLSREVLFFSLFAFAATAYSATLWFGFRSSVWLGALTVLLGLCGVGASARLYLAPGRPAWNS